MQANQDAAAAQSPAMHRGRGPAPRTARPLKDSLPQINARVVACTRCPRLIAHCRQVARTRRAAYRDWTYHGRPVPNFLPAAHPQRARVLIVGLAPAAHGGNRTGRMFTGDRSGDFLYRALFQTGFCTQPASIRAGDGLALLDCVITAACHCAPPANRPTPGELACCRRWLEQTFDALPRLRAVVCLGKLAFDEVLRLYHRRGWIARPSAYRFAHGVCHAVPGAPALLASYHPSQQNTFTGRLTPPMLRAVFARVRRIVAGPEARGRGKRRLRPAAPRGSPATA